VLIIDADLFLALV